MSEQEFTAATIPPEDSVVTADAIAPERSDEGLQEDAFRLPVKFNKQDYHLTLEEATTYAQKGMKFDTVEPMLQKLKTVAGANGLGVRELIDALCGDEPPTEQTVEQRLADEFRALREECPEVTAFSALPETVVRDAVENGVPLTLAYLRYEHRERARIADAAAAQRRASESSAGTQHTALQGAPDPAVEAMLMGVRRG